MSVEFLYFDLGMVLVSFSVERMCRQMGAVAGLPAERILELVIHSPLQIDYETGRLTSREYYAAFCQDAGTTPDYHALLHAAADIFEVNLGMLPVVSQLQAAGVPLGILSNTCECHWQHCWRHYAFLHGFPVRALSYELGAVKPHAEIFQAAARLAGVPPEKIFFVDDIAGHVAGARAVGYDAVVYQSAGQVVEELRKRGVRFNY